MCLSKSLLLGNVLEHLEHAKVFVSGLEATTLGTLNVVLGVIEMELFCVSSKDYLVSHSLSEKYVFTWMCFEGIAVQIEIVMF